MNQTGPGWVFTARGQPLNLDELISRQKKPVNQADLKGTVKKQVKPQRMPVNVRGFQPARTDTASPDAPVIAIAEEAQAPQEIKNTRSIADMTGVTVDAPRYMKNKGKAKNLNEVTDAALSEVLHEIEAVAKNTDGVPDKEVR